MAGAAVIAPYNAIDSDARKISARRLARAFGAVERGFGVRGTIEFMRVTTGKVIESKVVVEGLSLEEGALVTVLARESEETFLLTPEDEAELLLSIKEADRGEMFSAEEVLDSLPRC
jgi:hypothetical protein